MTPVCSWRADSVSAGDHQLPNSSFCDAVVGDRRRVPRTLPSSSGGGARVHCSIAGGGG